MIDRRSVRAVILSLFVLGLGGPLAACNTVEGMGKDLSAAGRAISNAFDSSGKSEQPAATPQPGPGTTNGSTGMSH